MIKKYINVFASMIISVVVLSSCFRKETPYPLPEKEPIGAETKEDNLDLGNQYINQIFYSLENGVVKTNAYTVWDLAFSTNDQNEVWMNNGKNILLYLTDANDLTTITSVSGLDAKLWKYDDNTGLAGKSGLGFIDNNTHLNKVIIAKITNNIYYKFIIKESNATAYVINVAALDGTTGTEYTIPKDNTVNFVYFSFTDGVLNIEPPKTDWDIMFTRYRYIYKGYNQDGSDLLYLVTGVLSNPYNTLTAGDSVVFRDYNTFNKDSIASMQLVPNLDNIGWNWKTVDINTGNYVVNSKMIYVIKDQKENYWKFHFYSYVNNLGVKGNPHFRFEKL